MKSDAKPTARERLRSVGLRATPARIAVLDLLSSAGRLLTHMEVVEQLSVPNIDMSTVFRVLRDLVEAGLARRLDAGDHSWRYEDTSLESPSSVEHSHPHLLCVACGTITCLTGVEVKLKLPRSLGTVEEILVKGRCAPCRDDEAAR